MRNLTATELEQISRDLRSLVESQGRHLLRRWPEAVPMTRHDRRDFTTQIDVEVEQAIKAELRSRFPGHGLSGEETEAENRGSDYQWLIDPIDGTKYYSSQSSLFSVSIGLLHRGVPILGLVYGAASRQCFYAWEGGGAYLDGQRLTGSNAREASEVIVNADTPKTHELSEAEREWFESKLLMLTRKCYRVRALGVGSLAACWLASGALDAYVDLTGYVKPQDIAAGRIIMQEAGAKVDSIDPGKGPRRLLAAPPAVWEELNQLLLA